MGRLYLVRHAVTDWNRSGRYQGSRDIPLSPDGIRQAEDLAACLADAPLAAVYSSPLRRAYETALPLARRGLAVERRSELVELCLGAWEGLTRPEVEARFPDLFRRWHSDPSGLRFPGGETLEEVRSRAVPAIRELAERHRDEVILVVSHTAVIKLALCEFLGLPLSRYWQLLQENCALNLVEWRSDGYPRLLLYNSTAHLLTLPSREGPKESCGKQ